MSGSGRKRNLPFHRLLARIRLYRAGPHGIEREFQIESDHPADDHEQEGPDHTLSSEVRRRLALAREIGTSYSGASGLMALLVGGSVAHGYADRWSDVDIGVFWTTLPPERSSAELAARAGLVEWHAYPDPSPTGALEEDGVRNGIKVDLVHLTCTSVEETIAAVIDHGNSSLEHQVLVAAIRDGLPLFGDRLLACWKTRVAVYPEELRIAMVQNHLIFGSHAWLEMLAERDDVLVLHDLLCRIGRAIITILLEINGVYARSARLKWTHQTIAQCTIAPPGFARRLDVLLRSDSTTAVAEAGRFIEETLALIDHHLPAVDTAPVRRRIAALPRGLQGRQDT